jgi:hypothetical protein
LRFTLIQAEGVLVNRPKDELDLSLFAYRQQVNRAKSYKLTCVKVAQKMARIVYHVLVGRIEYNPAHELQIKKQKQMEQQLKKHQTLLKSPRIRVLKRDISNFIDMNFTYLNSQTRFHLMAGFQKILQKATWEVKKSEKKE